LCAPKVGARVVQQGGVRPHLLGNKPMHGKATLVNAFVIAEKRFHAGIIAQACHAKPHRVRANYLQTMTSLFQMS